MSLGQPFSSIVIPTRIVVLAKRRGTSLGSTTTTGLGRSDLVSAAAEATPRPVKSMHERAVQERREDFFMLGIVNTILRFFDWSELPSCCAKVVKQNPARSPKLQKVLEKFVGRDFRIPHRLKNAKAGS